MDKAVSFSYFYGEESEQFSYYRIPRLLITGAQFKNLSTDAKLLYGLFLDRMGLSAKNGWYDEQGRVYIYYTLEEIMADLKNMPQKHLEHSLLTASATVDGNAVTMLTDNGSANAEAPLRVVNTPGFDLPYTGDNGTRWLTIAGTLLVLCAGGCVVLLIASKRKKNTRQ